MSNQSLTLHVTEQSKIVIQNVRSNIHCYELYSLSVLLWFFMAIISLLKTCGLFILIFIFIFNTIVQKNFFSRSILPQAGFLHSFKTSSYLSTWQISILSYLSLYCRISYFNIRFIYLASIYEEIKNQQLYSKIITKLKNAN